MLINLRQLAVMGLFMLACASSDATCAPIVSQLNVSRLTDTTGKDLDAKQAWQFIQANPEVIVLDVRTPDEFAAAHIDKAMNLNLHDADFTRKMARLDRSKKYVVHCAVGGRSRKAVAVMDSLGFTQVRHLNGGLTGWQKAGQPVVKHK
ncbi:rhodanese-like domain-containing protein [uncultured Fibrella sp.]|uniref:rhodanese-like domain-containing protein n=1 Tax=uncultured Fibrella sp. TaxID=1284596 RepID=UPI0035CB3D3F